MTNQITKLAFDPTMSNADNFIPNEQHTAESKVIVARFGGFFSKSLNPTQAGRPLIRGVDYKLGGYSADASRAVGQSVHYVIVILTTSSAPVILNYHALGGEWCSYTGVIVDMINELNLVDDIVRASDIVGLPEVFPPGPHKTHGDDLIGLSRVVEMMSRVKDAIETGNPSVMQSFRNALKSKVDSNGPIRLNPTNNRRSVTSPAGSASLHDLALKRSESATALVVAELVIVGEEGVINTTISYKEAPSGVATVSHNRSGGPSTSSIEFGVAQINGGRTVIRFKNAAGTKGVKDIFVKSIMSDSSERTYEEVEWLSTPTVVSVTMRPF